MEFKPFEPGIEVKGEALTATLAGFKNFPSLVMKYLVKYGLTKPGPGGIPLMVDRLAWIPQEKWLQMFQAIVRDVGANKIYDVGYETGLVAPLPPSVKTIEDALQGIDTAYHVGHRKRGKPMFDPVTGSMLEGIGHYGYQRVAREQRIIMTCENPYPCDFDRGLIAAMAARFQPRANVSHDDEKPCRKTGANSCTYIVVW